MNILFICLGNICRSPSAESIMNKKLYDHKLHEKIQCDSAGIIDTHEGQRADQRMVRALSKRGYTSTSYSRPIEKDVDFEEFDYIVAMDNENFKNLTAMAPSSEAKKKIFMMCDFATNRKEKEVPDPYYGGESGFELVIDILEDACEGLIEKLKKEL